jgi:hypothetical protein
MAPEAGPNHDATVPSLFGLRRICFWVYYVVAY